MSIQEYVNGYMFCRAMIEAHKPLLDSDDERIVRIANKEIRKYYKEQYKLVCKASEIR